MFNRPKSAYCMALALSVLALSSPSAWSQQIQWSTDIATARRASIEYKVPLLIHFHGDNCLPCKLLEQNVLNRSEVVDTLNKYFICVEVNASQDRATAA
ncbi:MAG: thioredoxin family protein, partial [Aureliella sp.]